MKKKSYKRLAFVFALAIAVPVTGVSSQAATMGKATSKSMVSATKHIPTTVRMTRLSDTSQAWGPTRQSSGNDFLINALVFDGLVRVASDETTILPDLATKWSASADAKEFTFTLAKNVKWSDGSPFTADDVIATINMECNFGSAAYLGWQPDQWKLVDGCDEVLGKYGQTAKGLIKVSSSQIKIRLKEPNSQFIRLITDAVYSIIPKKYIAGLTKEQYAVSKFVVSAPVGTGPYTLAKSKRDQYYEFHAKPTYFQGAPKIDTVFWLLKVKPTDVLPMLQKGQLDLAIDIPVELESQLKKLSKDFKPVWNNTVGQQFFEFQTDHGLAKNKLVRQAVMYAVDRRSMLKNLFGGHGAIRWMIGGFDQDAIPGLDKYEYNPTKAKALLKESGVDLSQEFIFMYSPTSDSKWSKMVPVIASQLEAVGLKVKLDPVDETAWVSMVVGNSENAKYDLTLNSGNDFGLGAARSSGIFNCKAPLVTFYANCELDQLYRDLLATPVAATQKAIEAKIAKILNEDVPFPALWDSQTLNAVSNRLGGSFKLFPYDRESTSNVYTWTMAPKK